MSRHVSFALQKGLGLILFSLAVNENEGFSSSWSVLVLFFNLSVGLFFFFNVMI